MKAAQFIHKIFFIEILKGMALTLRHLFSRSVTRQYPDEIRKAQPGFRGLHALAKYKTGAIKCVGCGLCAAYCPSQCIHIYTSEGIDNKKNVDRYEIDILRCVFCGFCVEACPYGAIVMTEHYEYSSYRREDFYHTKEMLLDNWDKFMGERKGDNYFRNFWRPLSSDFEGGKKS